MQTAQEKGLLKLVGQHEKHWQVIGHALGLCMAGVVCDVEDLNGNAAMIIKHVLDKYNEGFIKGRADAIKEAEAICRSNLCAPCSHAIKEVVSL